MLPRSQFDHFKPFRGTFEAPNELYFDAFEHLILALSTAINSYTSSLTGTPSLVRILPSATINLSDLGILQRRDDEIFMQLTI